MAIMQEERTGAGGGAVAPGPARRPDLRDRLGPNLDEAFDPKANSLTMLRLALASIVALVHASAIGFGWQPSFGEDGLVRHHQLGDLAVDGFFVLSGFLVTMSFLRLRSLSRYVWHRALRILPGFWVCLLVTAVVVAPIIALIEGRAALSVFPDSLGFVWRNAGLHMSEFSLGGYPSGTFTPGVINGALWTLFYEFLCYVLVAGLGLAGLLTRRRGLLLVVTAGAWLAQVVASTGLLHLPAPQLRRFVLLFLLGAAGHVFRRHVRINGTLALASLAVVAVGLLLTVDYRIVAAPAFAYLFLWATVRLPLRWDPGVDLSYGIYIFHWPIATLLALLGAPMLGMVPHVLTTLVLAGLAAVASWYFVEKPALSWKGHAFPAWIPDPGRRAARPAARR